MSGKDRQVEVEKVGRTILNWGNLLAEVEHMAIPQLFTLGGSGGMLPPKSFDAFRCFEAHSCILRDMVRHRELLKKRLISWLIICYSWLLETNSSTCTMQSCPVDCSSISSDLTAFA